MFKNYKNAALAAMGCCMPSWAFSQTHYGLGAGTQAQVYSHFGVNAGKVSIGPFNTFIGQESGASNTTGNGNTFAGYKSGTGNLTGIDNTFLGSQAGYANATGSQNTFLGKDAGISNVDGSDNTYLGYQAGAANPSGLSNCVVGFQANFQGLAGNYNAIFGGNAGQSNSGSDNVILGYASGYQNTGNANVFTGSYAGFSNTSGYENVYLGNNAGYHGSVGKLNTSLGTKAGFFNLSGDENVFVGNMAGFNNTSGQSNVFIGNRAGEENLSGRLNTYLGHLAGGSQTLNNATAVGALAKVTASNSLVLGSKANVGIGLSAPAFQLHLSTDAAAKPGSALWTVASDSRLKKNITDFTDGIELLKQIRPVRFQYNGKAGIETGDKQFIGIIAQEMQQIAPYMVGTFTHQDSLGNKTEYLDYDANAVVYMLINAVKEQQQEIEEKDKELKEVNAELAAMSKRLEKLESIVASGSEKPLHVAAAPVEPRADGVVLEQNVPNGFSEQSAIRYFIPQSVKEATMDIYSVNGVKVNSYPVKERGEGQLIISAGDFRNGVFLYDLVTDGKSNGVRKMVIQK